MGSKFEFTPEILEEGTNTPIEGAEITGTFAATDAADNLVTAKSGPDGKVKIDAVLITVKKPGFKDHVAQPYRRPSPDAVVRVHLRRL